MNVAQDTVPTLSRYYFLFVFSTLPLAQSVIREHLSNLWKDVVFQLQEQVTAELVANCGISGNILHDYEALLVPIAAYEAGSSKKSSKICLVVVTVARRGQVQR